MTEKPLKRFLFTIELFCQLHTLTVNPKKCKLTKCKPALICNDSIQINARE